MSITTVFTPPLVSDSPEVFNSKAFTLVGGLNTWSGEANTLAAAVTTKAGEAATSAASVGTSAATATTKASEAAGSATGAAASATTATTKANEAAASATGAAASAATATTQASAAAGSATSAVTQARAAAGSATAAATQASAAAGSATDAATQASAAAGSATDATGSAVTATTKASEAAASATGAAASATGAVASATVAATKSGEAAESATGATVSASTATTKASEAAASAATATTQASAAAGSAADAVTQASAAAASATVAATKSGEAAESATGAVGSAATATTQASAAAGSATSAAASATVAATKSGEAAESATGATVSASTATTKAGEAATSALKAQAWADNVQNMEVETGKYSAKHWAMQAQATVTGSLTYRGSLDASSGNYPVSPVLGDYYKISVSGTISTVLYNANDSIIYNGLTWDKIDSTDSVSSVSGKTGTVTLSGADVGLGSVDNTADTAKPVSILQAAAIAAAVYTHPANHPASVITQDTNNRFVTDAEKTTWNSKLPASDVYAWAKAATKPSYTATEVGLGNVTNTSDANKPVSTAQQTALDLKANLASPALTGSPSAPTAALGTNTTQLATTEFVSTAKEVISGKSTQLHIGTIVASCIDLPSTHSDGGAWIDRCQDKSWYTETLGGDRWIGRHATIAAAWTAAGSATGAVYQASATSGSQTSGKFYTPTSSSTVTQVYRGIKREYPKAGVVWIAESARVVGYDAGTGAMWRVSLVTAGYSLHSGTITSIAAKDGVTVVGMSTQAIELNYMAGMVSKRDATNYTFNSLGFSSQVTAGTWNVINTTALIINGAVNSVAITTLDNAPIDPATNLPVPTIAVATAGNGTYSTSVIKHNGTVANIASDSTGTALSVDFDGKALKVVRSDGTVYIWNDITNVATGAAPDQTISASTTPALLGTVSKSTTRAKGSTLGLTLIKRNPTTLASSMVARVTERAPAFWQNGDIRFAGLADTVAETITASGELVTNGTFDTDTSGWTGDANSTITWDSGSGGRMLVTFLSAGQLNIPTISGLIVGKVYVLRANVTSGTAVSYIFSQSLGGWLTGTVTDTFVATATNTPISIYGGGAGYGYYDNISVKLADPDRSVKNNGLTVVGSLTKTAVASGAQLVGYSAWATTAYFTQPYSANHDYSTTGFCGALWLKEAPNSAIEYLLNRDSATPAQAIRLWVSAAGFLVFELYDGTTTRTATGTVAVDDTTWKLVIFDYSAGTLNIYVNDTLYATATGAALLTLNNAAAVLQIGLNVAGTLPATNASIALVRLSATILSADQRSQLYRDELPLFQPNAQCAIAGTSPAVTALAYDDSTDVLKVGTSYGVSSFKGLQRISSDTVAALGTTTVTSIASSGGMTVVGGSAGSNLYVPAKYLRDELQRRDEARKALGRIPVFFDFDAVTSQVAFVLPAGYTTKAVYSAGLLKRIGSTKDFTTNTDGYKETVTFAVAPGNTVQVSIMAVRA